MIRVEPLHPLFAAEVSGVDLGRPLQATVISEITVALDARAVLVFRDQPLTSAQQIAFSERFGVLEETVSATLRGTANSRLGEPRIAEVSNLGPDGAIRPPGDRWRLMQQANGLDGARSPSCRRMNAPPQAARPSSPIFAPPMTRWIRRPRLRSPS
jgi:alpha-ketoglutarate-dependent 2,4-dichlorophenoxyacetate dioxygenase